MKVKELMERVGSQETGKAIAYIKDGLEELEMLSSENVHSGERAYYEANTLSFAVESEVAGDLLGDNNWTDATGTTAPTGWTKYETYAYADNTHTIDSGRLKLILNDTILPSQAIGLFRSFTTEIGKSYTIKYYLVTTLADGFYSSFQVSDGFDATGLTGTELIGAVHADNAAETGATFELSFTATGTTTYFSFACVVGSIGEYILVDDVKLYNSNRISDSANGFITAGFTAGQKLKLTGSESNDTDELSNTTTGYYTISGVVAGQLSFIDEAFTAQSAGDTMTLIGSKPNYINIVAGKRYYKLPDDFIKMKDVKIKNHRNASNEYRSIPRMIHEPINRDEDDI